MHVAVIGAGAAGLVCARELTRKGHHVHVYEGGRDVGGLWDYTSDVEDDLLGKQPSRRIHASIYKSLRTNLPGELMAFRDYPFTSKGGGRDDWPRYPHHTQVLAYLKNFAADFGLLDIISFNDSVSSVQLHENRGWVVSSRLHTRVRYDAVAVCTGHYTLPRVPVIANVEHFAGKLMHSHNYRSPEGFVGKRVALLGAASSGIDLSREIATVADHVYWCANTFPQGHAVAANMTRHKPPASFHGERGLLLSDGSSIDELDAFIFCTGYEYQYPFLDSTLVSVTDNWVHPLYLDVLSQNYPTLGFIGVPFLVIPFPLFELQAQWFAALLSSEIVLPSRQERHLADLAHRQTLEQSQVPMHHYHKLAQGQFDYMNRLAKQCGADPLVPAFIQASAEAARARLSYPETYRDLPG